jgi:hypothetical protein
MRASEIVPRPSVVARVAELRRTYASRRRLVIEDVLHADVAERIASEIRRLPFVPVVNAPIERARRPAPRFWHHHAIVEADPGVARSAVEAFVTSLACGPFRDFVADITMHPDLYNHLGRRRRPILVAHAYPRGGYLEEHADAAVDGGSRRAVALVWHASARWEATWGGALRFAGADAETFFPRFGDLHLFEAHEANRHEVTMVTGTDVRYTLSGWLYERAP